MSFLIASVSVMLAGTVCCMVHGIRCSIVTEFLGMGRKEDPTEMMRETESGGWGERGEEEREGGRKRREREEERE